VVESRCSLATAGSEVTTRKPLILGPFSKGLNTYDDPTAIQDTELVDALNFDPGFDGSLRSRPPFTDTLDPLTLGATGTPHLLGYYYDNSGVAHLLAGDGLSSTWRYSSGVWSLITNTFSATDMAQFDGKAWLLPPVGEADPGGYWTPSGGFVPDADMPKGLSITSYKSRLWIAEGVGGTNPTRIRYSKVLGQPSFWASPGFMDVGAGDGQSVVKILAYFDTMLVFRTKSIWSFQYGVDPATAIQGVVVPGVGLQTPRALVAYENYLYFMYDEKAYQFVNNRAQQINIKVPFRASNLGSTQDPFHVSLFNNRILYSFYELIYVYSLRTQTWTTWRSDVWGPIGQVMSSFVAGDTDEAFALPSKPTTLTPSRTVALLHIEDRFSNDRENMTCSIQTKNYNFDVPGSYKVLFWWGLDAIFRTNVVGQVSPVLFNAVTMWGQIRTGEATWGTLRDHTWRFPLSEGETFITTEVVAASGPARKFVKFFKKLRFRQIFFRIRFQTDGSTSSAPVQIFTISTYMAEKETVSKQIS